MLGNLELMYTRNCYQPRLLQLSRLWRVINDVTIITFGELAQIKVNELKKMTTVIMTAAMT